MSLGSTYALWSGDAPSVGPISTTGPVTRGQPRSRRLIEVESVQADLREAIEADGASSTGRRHSNSATTILRRKG